MASSTLPLAGKTAIITGASKGIGRATSLVLASQGANVVINYSSEDGPATDLAATINSSSERSPPQATVIKADAGDVEDIGRLVSRTIAIYGKIDIVIANAGFMPMADLEHVTEEIFDKVMRLNVKGPFFLVQKAAPHMPSGSHVILVSTTLCAASTVQPPYLPYVASKGAIEQMVRVMSKDLARKGISVNAVAPGPTGTELFYRGKSEQLLNIIKGFNPQNRIGTPEEIADVMAFLSGEGSRWITGQVLRVNGGMA